MSMSPLSLGSLATGYCIETVGIQVHDISVIIQESHKYMHSSLLLLDCLQMLKIHDIFLLHELAPVTETNLVEQNRMCG